MPGKKVFAVRMEAAQINRIRRLARRRGYRRGKRVNVSDAAREVVNAGLKEIEREEESHSAGVSLVKTEEVNDE